MPRRLSRHPRPPRIIPSLFPISLVLALLATPLAADGDTWSLDGFALLRAGQATGQTSWVDGGFGRLPYAAEEVGETDFFASAQIQAALDWHPSPHLRTYVHALARQDSQNSAGEDFGIVEAYLEGTFFFRTADELRVRLGHFFLPTSKENVEILWSSPYTLSWSAINSWIGEEVRPTGLSTEARFVLPRSQTLTVGGSGFGGNDTQGALLAWRGWSQGDRLTVWDELLALPPLDALEDGGIFARQRDDGTRPFGEDLDDEIGWAAWLAWSLPERFSLQWTRLDNRANRRLVDGEYAWETSFDLVGAELHGDEAWSLVGEWLRGETGMGATTPFLRSQNTFESWYLLASWKRSRWRITLRWDDFEIEDRDLHPAGVLNDEDGRALTAAVLWDPTPSLRFGIELVELDAIRPEAALSGGDADTDARLLQVELRWYF